MLSLPWEAAWYVGILAPFIGIVHTEPVIGVWSPHPATLVGLEKHSSYPFLSLDPTHSGLSAISRLECGSFRPFQSRPHLPVLATPLWSLFPVTPLLNLVLCLQSLLSVLGALEGLGSLLCVSSAGLLAPHCPYLIPARSSRQESLDKPHPPIPVCAAWPWAGHFCSSLVLTCVPRRVAAPASQVPMTGSS